MRTNSQGLEVRRYRKAYVEIPKKNGKSTIASGVGLYMLCGDDEAGAEVYSSAVDRNQANTVHREAVNMVDQSPELSDALQINRSTFNIFFPDTHSFYRALASRANSNEGFNAHCILADELHAWEGDAGRALYQCIKYAFAARSQPLFFQITTAGKDLTGVCREQHDYAGGVLSGTIEDDGFFPLIYAADPADNPWDEATWWKANPSLGHTISLESFAADAAEANKTPTAQASFRRYRLNIWTTGDSPWLRLEDWNACRQTYTAEDLHGRRCYAAWDLSRTNDSTSLQLVFPPVDDGEPTKLLSYFWLPAERAVEMRGVVPWETWAEQGHVELIPGAVMEYAVLEARWSELAQQFDLLQMTFDKIYAEDITLRMEQATGIPRESFPQTVMYFAGPTAEFERRVLNRTIAHNGQPVMTWQIANAVIYTDPNNNKKPRKQKPNDPRKVDGVVAAVMAVALDMRANDQCGASWYDDHDVEAG